jgi:hypothetical protein
MNLSVLPDNLEIWITDDDNLEIWATDDYNCTKQSKSSFEFISSLTQLHLVVHFKCG